MFDFLGLHFKKSIKCLVSAATNKYKKNKREVTMDPWYQNLTHLPILDIIRIFLEFF